MSEPSLLPTIRAWLSEAAGVSQAPTEAIVARAAAGTSGRVGDPAFLERLVALIAVPETSFFRHPEQFASLAELPPDARVWSAGCATGEEPWSIAASLEALHGVAAPFEVLGTDLVEGNVLAARAGRYGRWSLRSPPLHPVVEPRPDGASEVRATLRPKVRFARHNLLQPCDAGPFHAVFCRNVLMYLHPTAAERAWEHLLAALLPGGLIVLGSVDPAFGGVERADRPELATWRKAPAPSGSRPSVRLPAALGSPRATALPSTRGASRAAPTPVPAADPPGPAYLAALRAAEAGDLAAAERVLVEIRRHHPGFLPALLEHALLRARAGAFDAARELMMELEARASALPPDVAVDGPYPLPASTYAQTARAFLGAPRRGHP